MVESGSGKDGGKWFGYGWGPGFNTGFDDWRTHYNVILSVPPRFTFLVLASAAWVIRLSTVEPFCLVPVAAFTVKNVFMAVRIKSLAMPFLVLDKTS